MSKQDYFVVAYKILKYLYECLKSGKDPDMTVLSADYLSVNESYWRYILTNLASDEYIFGIVTADGGFAAMRPDIHITPKGIQYLEENSMFEKIKRNLKDIREIMPI